MEKNLLTFSVPWRHLPSLFGLVALMAMLPSAAGAASAKPEKVRTATAVKRAKAPSHQADSDHDGLTNATEERRTKTNPRKFDTDGDGFGDGAEVAAGTNPRDRHDSPVGPPASPPAPVAAPEGEKPAAPMPPPAAPEPAEPPAPPDTTAPQTTIDSGPAGTTTAADASFQFASSEDGSSFQCRRDSGSWTSCSSPTAYGSLAVGSHTFAVRATDEAGNVDSTPASRTWTVEAAATPPPPDTTAPQTTIDAGPSGATTNAGASFQFSSNESDSSFRCQLDSGSWGSCASPKAYSSVAVGAHTFSVKATDVAGNTDTTPASRSWTVEAESPGVGCTQTVASGANLSNAISAAAGGAVICLSGGSYSVNVTKANKASMVTVKAAAGASPTLGYSMLNQATDLRFEDLKFTGGIEALGPSSRLQFVDNEFTGPFGIHANGQENSNGSSVTDVLVEGNNIHNLDYTGSQGTANGYGVTASNGVARFTIRGNTIKSPASDYIQFASPETAVIDHNTFLGPSLLGSHQDHQDLVQIFGGGENISFTNNVARNTETQESLLFQEGAFTNVVVENNLFDHDSRGYTCQIYQSKGLIFRDNTIVGSHWGCLFRDLASSAAGSGYQIDHNVFTNTAEGSDLSTEGRAGGWGTYDYNVSEDGSASGSHSVKNWKPSWVDTTNYTPVGLSFLAGYRP